MSNEEHVHTIFSSKTFSQKASMLAKVNLNVYVDADDVTSMNYFEAKNENTDAIECYFEVFCREGKNLLIPDTNHEAFLLAVHCVNEARTTFRTSKG
mgnify:FL=1|jgi:hypothetical protein